jgi:Peptidase MA superfamily
MRYKRQTALFVDKHMEGDSRCMINFGLRAGKNRHNFHNGAAMRNLLTAFFLGLSLLTVSTVHAAPQADVTQTNVVLNFPETATFSATITADADIVSVVLEYGNKQQTCGEVIAKAYPEFTPGRTVEASWTWEMRQSGSLPPGAQLWWRWRITDANGNQTVSETQTAAWLDDTHSWKTINEGIINLHWYEGDNSFARDLLSAAQSGLEFNRTQSGLATDEPIDIYIYADTFDMQEAMLYEPSWTGGRAYSDYNIVVIGISETDLEWGRDAMVHELTHILVGHLTFSCLGDVPTWLNEGLAMFSEGGLDEGSRQQLEIAIQDDKLLSLRSLSAGFAELPDKINLSYSQSYSVVKYLIDTYGQEKMTALLTLMRDGNATDAALQQTYGFNTEALEDQWRAAIGAQPRTVSAQATAQPTPTFVPTIVPVSGGSFVLQATPTAIPTSTGGQSTETPQRTAPPLWLTLTLLGFCCLFLLIIGVVVLGFVVRSQNMNEGKNA